MFTVYVDLTLKSVTLQNTLFFHTETWPGTFNLNMFHKSDFRLSSTRHTLNGLLKVVKWILKYISNFAWVTCVIKTIKIKISDKFIQFYQNELDWDIISHMICYWLDTLWYGMSKLIFGESAIFVYAPRVILTNHLTTLSYRIPHWIQREYAPRL